MYLVAWLNPRIVPAATLVWLNSMVLLELVGILAASILGSYIFTRASKANKLRGFAGSFAIIAIIAVAFAVAFHAWQPVVGVCLLAANRLTRLLAGRPPRGAERAFLQRSWAGPVLLWMALGVLTTWLPVPRLGLTREIATQDRLIKPGPRAIGPEHRFAFGFVYFLAVGISELTAFSWVGFADPSGRPKKAGGDA